MTWLRKNQDKKTSGQNRSPDNTRELIPQFLRPDAGTFELLFCRTGRSFPLCYLTGISDLYFPFASLSYEEIRKRETIKRCDSCQRAVDTGDES